MSRGSAGRRAPGATAEPPLRGSIQTSSRLPGVASTARVPGEPELGEVLVSAEDLQRRVVELGEEISRDYAGRPLLLVGRAQGRRVLPLAT